MGQVLTVATDGRWPDSAEHCREEVGQKCKSFLTV